MQLHLGVHSEVRLDKEQYPEKWHSPLAFGIGVLLA